MMNENHAGHGAVNGAMMSFLVGAVVGAGVALLVAPASGSDTRRRLSDSARKLGNDASSKFSEVRDVLAHGAENVKGDLKDAVEAGRAAARRV